MKFAIVEKKNRFAVHGYFDSLECATGHLKNVIPEYVSRRYYTDKKLTVSSFRIIRVKGAI